MNHSFFAKTLAGVALLSAVCVAPPGFAAEIVTLKDTVSSALAYSPNIKSFQEYRQAAVHDLKRARSGWFPKVDARAGYGFEQWSDPTSRSHPRPQRGERGLYDRDPRTFYSRSEASLTVSQTIWDGLDTWNRYQIGKSRLESAESRLFDNAEALGLDGVLAHIEIYRQRRIIALAELNVKNHKMILASQRERRTSGAATEADVTQIQSRLSRAEASLTESRLALEVALANYKRITGKIPAELEAPAAPAGAYPSLEVAMAQSQTGNMKVRALRADASTAESQGELDKAAFHPQIYLEAGPSYTYRSGSSQDDQGGVAVMLRANWNLFNGGYDWYNVKGSKARARQARQDINAQLNSLAQETEATWSELVSSRELIKHYSNAVTYSTRTRDMYLEQFNVGQRSLLDVLDAENELFSSSIQLVTAQQNVIAAQYRLIAIGGDFLGNFGMNRQPLAVATD
jgi:adhesin transport system outer membrane protein